MQSYAPKMLKNAFLCFILKKINLVQAVFQDNRVLLKKNYDDFRRQELKIKDIKKSPD